MSPTIFPKGLIISPKNFFPEASMAVKNVTRNTLIAARSKLADSILGRAVGLMFSKPTQAAIILKFDSDTAISLHTFFVFYPIDIILVDSRLKVVETATMQPFTTFSARNKAKYVVEVPSGTIRKSRTKLGDEIIFLHVIEKKTKNGRHITVRRGKAPKSS